MGVCIVENLSRVFLSEWPPILLWVMMVYIVWVKGKKVTLKNPPSKEFHEYFARRPYPWDIHKTNNLAWLLSFQSCASHMAISRVSFSQASRNLLMKSFCFSNTCSILHQLNTKLNTIKSHKIQEITLK